MSAQATAIVTLFNALPTADKAQVLSQLQEVAPAPISAPKTQSREAEVFQVAWNLLVENNQKLKKINQ